MGKFRIRLKLQGFELEMDGDREDIPAMKEAIQQQFGGMISAPDVDPSAEEPSSKPNLIDMKNVTPKRTLRRRNPPPKPPEGQTNGPIDFRHDSAKYGSPKQAWTVAQKCIWLLYVLEGISGIKEANASQLTSTFNAQFKAAGRIHPPHTPRDLGFAKVSSPAPIGEDKGMWFLTDKGKEQAQELIAAGKS